MPKGISLHIGVNKVDDTHYRGASVTIGWEGVLSGCENDAIAMEALAKENGFMTDLLLTKKATRQNVKTKIAKASKTLSAGDYFFLTYAGHGSQVADISGDEKLDMDIPSSKRDRRDETWCLYDAQLLDDELFHLLAGFSKGVRILMLSDSCHSGTVARDMVAEMPEPAQGRAFRVVPRATLANTYIHHRAFYDSLQAPKGSHPEIEASVILFSGCQDDQLSQEDQLSAPPHGIFTLNLLDAWNAGSIDNYKAFFQAVIKDMPEEQTPNLLAFGGAADDFLTNRPFFITH